MLAKDIVSSRLETGISFTEFTYQILQSMDFLHLFKHHDVRLQVGGADQAEKVATEPHKREAQKTLASEMTVFVHGEEALNDALSISAALFSGDVKQLSAKQIEEGFKNMPSASIGKETMNLVDWLIETKVEPSKRQAREDITNGAIYINGDRIQDLDFEITEDISFDGRFIIVRKGKKKYTLINLV